MNEQYARLLRGLPVSVNNLADPALLRDSTAAKLDTLAADGHTGPVALITKGNLGTFWWRERLPGWASQLDLFVFASISGLPREIEPSPTEHRFATLRAAREAGARPICYLRPIVAGRNDRPEVLRPLLERAADAGAHAVVSSGFRGDEETVEATGLADVEAPDGQHWSRTLKITSQATSDWLVEETTRLRLPYWTRTSCAVAALRGDRYGVNPYHMAPKFVGCERCPLQATCMGGAQFRGPAPGSVDLLRHLGFEVTEHTPAARYSRCEVQRRQSCSLCCTNCPVAPASFGVPWLQVRQGGGLPSWGDMSFARFVSGGMLCTDPDIKPGEDSRVSLHPRFRVPDGTSGVGPLYAVNSWCVWSEYLPMEQCLRCSYCFLRMFRDQLPEAMRKTVGCSPSQVLSWEAA